MEFSAPRSQDGTPLPRLSMTATAQKFQVSRFVVGAATAVSFRELIRLTLGWTNCSQRSNRIFRKHVANRVTPLLTVSCGQSGGFVSRAGTHLAFTGSHQGNKA